LSVARESVDLENTGWWAILPGVAAEIVRCMSYDGDRGQEWFVQPAVEPDRFGMGSQPAEWALGSLIDEASLIRDGILPPDGLNAVYEPAEDTCVHEPEVCVALWDQWKKHAEDRGRPMRTYGDMIDFMAELGILERVRESWQLAPRLPDPKTVLTFSE
jgi:hypothetical protein